MEGYLGIQLYRDVEAERLFVQQQRYLSQVTTTTGPGSAVRPLTFNLRLDPADQAPAVDRSTYLSKVGQVSYASVGTLPNLTYPHRCPWRCDNGLLQAP